ncbi:MAG: hypothetical protein Ct9H300mP1_11610 [Planctomycetaceae bacterium]|nr:MAG: hypothetical protein Ct9H300mP1_11610 [Planctomycetaceae bacterium]
MRPRDACKPHPPKLRAPPCPVCGGQLIEIRHKLVCSRCHSICETCCEGGAASRRGHGKGHRMSIRNLPSGCC